jgi:hypothetical protein
MSLTSTQPGERLHPDTPAALRPRRRRALRVTCALLAIAALSGCQSVTMNSAELRVIDASPDAGVIDSYQNSAALAYNLGFGTMTSYIPMAPGAYNLTAAKAGTRQTLVAGNATFEAGRQYTQIVGSGIANMQQTVFLDQSTPAPSGQIALRFIDEATRPGAVDIYLVPLSTRAASTAPIAANLGFGATSGYINAPVGTYSIDVVPTGTTLASSTVTLLSGPQVEYASGAVRTVVLIDQETTGARHTPGVQTIVAEDADAQ